MTHASVWLACLVLIVATSARADLSLVGRSTVNAMGMQGIGQEGLWLRKTKLRRDMIDRGKAYSHLYDLASREITIIDHSLRQARVYAMSALNQDADARVSGKNLRLDLNPTGRKHQLQGWNCLENRIHVAMPVELAGVRVSFEMVGTRA